PASVQVQNSEGANDSLVVNALGGNDRVSAATLPADIVALTVDGGTGNDTVLGSRGADRLVGGEGNDFIDGKQGNDAAFMGAGDDVFQWDPGDGSDIVEGQDGADTMLFNGANVSEQVDLSANGNRLKFSRTQGNVTMDTAGVERVDFNALGGADLVTVNDLTGTDVHSVNVRSEERRGGTNGDPDADSVTDDGTNGNDTINVSGDASAGAR